MSKQVLIAHAADDEALAEELAVALSAAGFEVAHRGTVLVGSSFVRETTRILRDRSPVVLCGTVRALGDEWVLQQVNAGRFAGCRIYCLRMEKEADLEGFSFDEKVGEYWREPIRTLDDLVRALRTYPGDDSQSTAIHVASEAPRKLFVPDVRNLVESAALPDFGDLATQRAKLHGLPAGQVDQILLAILAPEDIATGKEAQRARSILAALCLADEPDVNDATAESVLRSLSHAADERDVLSAPVSSLQIAVAEVSASRWQALCERIFLEEFVRRPPLERDSVGRTLGTALLPPTYDADKLQKIREEIWENVAEGFEATVKALLRATALTDYTGFIPTHAVEIACSALDKEPPLAFAGLQLLICGFETETSNAALRFYSNDVINSLSRTWPILQEDLGTRVSAIKLMGWLEMYGMCEAVCKELDSTAAASRVAAAEALGRMKCEMAIDSLISHLREDDDVIRSSAVTALLKILRSLGLNEASELSVLLTTSPSDFEVDLIMWLTRLFLAHRPVVETDFMARN